jgi:ABC-type protease/lipase transport system fused ATPase/permease subunit
MNTSQKARSGIALELRAAVKACTGALAAVAMVSCLVNLLMLNGPLFMLQVYDRVLPSSSIPTLVGLFLIAFALFGFQGLLDAMRGRMLSRIGLMLDEKLTPRVFDPARPH